jgi:hypothetical protein
MVRSATPKDESYVIAIWVTRCSGCKEAVNMRYAYLLAIAAGRCRKLTEAGCVCFRSAWSVAASPGRRRQAVLLL